MKPKETFDFLHVGYIKYVGFYIRAFQQIA